MWKIVRIPGRLGDKDYPTIVRDGNARYPMSGWAIPANVYQSDPKRYEQEALHMVQALNNAEQGD